MLPDPNPDNHHSVVDTDEGNATRHISFDQEDDDTHPSVTIWLHRKGDDRVDMRREVHLYYEWRERCLCGQRELKAERGKWKTLTSPDYPQDYCNNMRCDYVIRADEGEFLRVNVTEFISGRGSFKKGIYFFDSNTTTGRHSEV